MTLDRLLEDFFGPGNEVSFEGLIRGDYGQSGQLLEPWLHRLRYGHWSVLPRRTDDALAWYAVTHSISERERVSLILRAWIGPGFTDFDGQPPSECADDWERRLQSHVGSNWLRCRVLPGRTDDVRLALSRLVDLEQLRPAVVAQDVVPTGRLVRDFDWALRARDENVSRSILQSLETSGRLSAMNLQYLRIQRFHALQLWDAMISMPGLADVVASRRPRAVTKAVLRGLFEYHLAGPLKRGDISAVAAVFGESIAGRFNALFGSLPMDPQPHELWLYALWASTAPAKPELLSEVASSIERIGIQDDRLLAYLGAFAGPEEALDPMVHVKRAIDDCAYGSALEQLRRIEDGVQHAALTITCAIELDTPDALGFAALTLERLSNDEMSALRSSRVMRGLIERVEVYSERPHTWAALAEGIRDGSVQAQDLDWVRGEVQNWDHSRLMERHEAVVEAVTSDLGVEERQVLRSVLPWLLDSIDRYPAVDDVRLRDIGSAVAHALALSETRSTQERDALTDLCERMLDGASQSQYIEVLELLAYVLETDDSPYLVPWVLEILEVVAGYPVGETSARDQLASRAVGFLQRRSDRLTIENRLVASLVIEELGLAAESIRPVSEYEPGQLGTWPNNTKIGIYTLTPGVGERVVGYVQSIHPNVSIQVNSDHVSTEGLRNLAQEADVFVIVSRSAKHAATDAIKDSRSKESPILYPSGKGSSSIIKALNEYMASLEMLDAG